MNTAALQNSKHNTAETVISARSLRQVFSTRAAGTVVAVDSIDLTVKRGEIIALLGPNGAGKTTLIDMILGLTQPSGGELSVFGRNASEAARAGLLGAVQQTGGLLKDLTIRATVEMIAALYPKPIDVDEVLAGADLTDIAKRKVGKCSGGQQQRVGIARAFVAKPEIVFADEPTGNLDTKTTMEVMELIHAMARRNKQTIVMVTHDPRLASYGDKIIHILDGNIQNVEVIKTAEQIEEESRIEIEKFKELQKEKKKARAEKLAKLMGKKMEEIKDEAKENV